MLLDLLTTSHKGAALDVYLIGGFIVGVLLLVALCFLVPQKLRKPVIMGATFLAGLYYALEFLIPARTPEGGNFLSPYVQPLGDVIAVVGAFALGLGTWSLMTIHAKAIQRRRPGWGNSLGFYIALISMATLGLAKFYYPTSGAGVDSAFKSLYDILFNGMLVPLGATMFSLIAFYIVSAAYRAFRIRSWESALMMGAAFLVMLGPVPVAQLATSWIPANSWASMFRIEHISYWILSVPNMAAQRGMQFGIGVGAMAMALRIWLSLERGSYFDKQI